MGKLRFYFILFFSCASLSIAAMAGNSEEIVFVYPEATDAVRFYNRQREFFQIARPLMSGLVIICLLQTGVLSKIRDALAKLPGSFPIRTFIFFIALLSILFLIDLPASFYLNFVLEHSMGLSNQSISSFATEKLKYLAVQAAMSSFLLPIAAIVRSQQRYWSISIWLLLALLASALVFIRPILIDPLFNNFNDIPQVQSSAHLQMKIEELCIKAGLNKPKVFVVDRSKQSKKVNAYVAGIAGSTRIVLYDTLIKGLPEDEVLMVVAHEIGHYKFKHIYIGMLFSILGALPALLAAEFILVPLLPKLPARWAVRTKSDPLFFAFAIALLQISEPFLLPIESTVAKYIETEADDEALRLLPEPRTAAKLFARLSQIDMADPNPPAIIEFWLYTHPSIKHRIERVLRHPN